MTTLNVRIEEKTKTQAAKVLEKMGLDMSSAIKLFLTQVVKEDGLPFTPTNKTKQIRARWDREVTQALKASKTYRSGTAVLKDL